MVKSLSDLGNNLGCSLSVVAHLQENILDACPFGHDYRSRKPLWRHGQISWSTLRPARCMPNGPALHEDNRLLAITTYWRSGQPQDIFGPSSLEEGLERKG